jgi:hypothetical protein
LHHLRRDIEIPFLLQSKVENFYEPIPLNLSMSFPAIFAPNWLIDLGQYLKIWAKVD